MSECYPNLTAFKHRLINYLKSLKLNYVFSDEQFCCCYEGGNIIDNADQGNSGLSISPSLAVVKHTITLGKE